MRVKLVLANFSIFAHSICLILHIMIPSNSVDLIMVVLLAGTRLSGQNFSRFG